MKRLAALLFPALLLGCQPGRVVKTTVLPNGNVRIALDGLETCIDSIEIRQADSSNESGTMWRIESVPEASPEICHSAVEYPAVPMGFEVTAGPVPLAAGHYWVTGKASQYWLSGDFEIPTKVTMR